MKKNHFLYLALICLSTITTANAQSKLATVDMKKLFNGYYKTKLAQTSLENRRIELRKEMKDMADELDKAQNDYKALLDQANQLGLTSEEREKRQKTAADKLREINNYRGTIEQSQRGAEAKLADLSQRMSGNLVVDIQKAVAEKAKTDGYTEVLNSASIETVVYAGPEHDLTASVLKNLNIGAPPDFNPEEPATLPTGTNSNKP